MQGEQALPGVPKSAGTGAGHAPPRSQVTSLHTETLGLSLCRASLGAAPVVEAAGAVPVAGGGRGGTRRWEKSWERNLERSLRHKQKSLKNLLQLSRWTLPKGVCLNCGKLQQQHKLSHLQHLLSHYPPLMSERETFYEVLSSSV